MTKEARAIIEKIPGASFVKIRNKKYCRIKYSEYYSGEFFGTTWIECAERALTVYDKYLSTNTKQ